MNKIPVLLDCDTGFDDAFAIAMAIASDRLEVKGVTTVAGNYTLPDVLLNTRRTLSITDPSVPYAVGAAQPLLRPLYTHGHPTHMMDELGDPDIAPDPRGAVEFMADILRESDEPITLIPLGPLTNIAVLLAAHPELKEKIKEMVIMGGSVYSGNTTPSAEFNIYVDPEAAHMVFKSGVPIVMCGLEVCEDARVNPDHAHRLIELGNPTAVAYGNELLRGFTVGESIIFDAVPVAYILHPEIVKTERYYVEVDITGGLSAGCTVTDTRAFHHDDAPAPNTTVAMSMDREKFGELLVELFSSFGK
ncbi:nucleoside hydrolase [Acetanaerobacterium sp. MSJ-12]|uniref:Nucleoside hydrolase n=1 Tax=Bittarella massiliensis (ex Durand et al. 2017) TaxID=1720313 RepID=A0AAW5K5N1_9FIRM|nr:MULTISPECIES: nucleoside hydrolase [Oscillospiraceae]MBC2871920.1 nucleoside hydrolase [Bittarella massiliensis (ex Durand et al. 2017)]MBU5420312.1 nucleoside hydrolase [Acetanaerobacterium sp. MSJ-12]MCQ4948152.1 nucleoside hydrolase [Bittarella massiliensis (ex Durand et al. 2017)]